MASTATTSLGLEKQGTGENNNLWGGKLNTGVFDLVDEAVAGVVAFSLSGSKTLTSTNYVSNEARNAAINVTGGTGGTVTIPAVSKMYFARNGSSGDVTFSNGSNSVAVKAGNIVPLITDGTNIYQVRCLDYGSDLLSSSGTPTDGSHLVNKTYADNLALSATLPGQSGNSGKVLTTNGSSASWGNVSLTAAVTGTLPEANGGTGFTAFGSGVSTFLQTPSSANLRTAVTDETGTGSLVFANAPTLTNPVLGTPASVTLTNGTGLPISTGVSGLATGVATFLATPSSANLRAALTDETGTGAAVFASAPTFTDKPTLPASASGNASLNMPHGSAPSSPSNGDIWTTTAGMYVRINGATYGPFATQIQQIGSTVTNPGASSVVFSSIPTTYSCLLLRYKRLGTASSGNLSLSLGSAGTWYSTGTPIDASVSSSDNKIGNIFLPGYNLDDGAVLGSDSDGSAALGMFYGAQYSAGWEITGGIKRVRLENTAGSNFTSPTTISLWGF